MKRYYSYKDSGIEWIGEIPEHWGVRKFNYLFSFSRGLSITKQDLKDEGVPCVNYGEIHSKFGFEVNPEKNRLKCVENEYLKTSEKSLLNRGDFIFADTSEDIEGSGNFTHLHSDIPTFAGYHTIIAKQKESKNYRYLAYFFDSLHYRNQIRSEVSGKKVFSITQAILKNSSVVIPTPSEQTAIARYLDRKTVEIDALVADKKRLLELYEEEKMAIINQAVTKGLNPDAPMRDSGIEWLGEVPVEWEVKRLRHLGWCQNGIGISSDAFGKNYPFVSYSDVGNNETLPMEVKGLVESSSSDRKKYSEEEGDVFFTRTSETIEEIAFASTCLKTIENAVFAGFLIRWRPFNNILDNGFKKYYFRAQVHRRFFVKGMNLVTRASLSQELLKKLPVLTPPRRTTTYRPPHRNRMRPHRRQKSQNRKTDCPINRIPHRPDQRGRDGKGKSGGLIVYL
jgi:type I restriction enzyme S subunit